MTGCGFNHDGRYRRHGALVLGRNCNLRRCESEGRAATLKFFGLAYMNLFVALAVHAMSDGSLRYIDAVCPTSKDLGQKRAFDIT